MEFIQLIHCTQVDDHIERYGILAVLRMEHIAQLGKVEQTEDLEAFLYFGRHFATNSLDSKFQRVRLRFRTECIPVGMTVFIDCTKFECVVCFSFQSIEQQFCIFDSSVQHVVEFDFIIVGIAYLVPGWFQGISFYVFGGNLSVGNC